MGPAPERPDVLLACRGSAARSLWRQDCWLLWCVPCFSSCLWAPGAACARVLHSLGQIWTSGVHPQPLCRTRGLIFVGDACLATMLHVHPSSLGAGRVVLSGPCQDLRPADCWPELACRRDVLAERWSRRLEPGPRGLQSERRGSGPLQVDGHSEVRRCRESARRGRVMQRNGRSRGCRPRALSSVVEPWGNHTVPTERQEAWAGQEVHSACVSCGGLLDWVWGGGGWLGPVGGHGTQGSVSGGAG